MAQRPRSRVSSVTCGSSLKTRDTVFALTPATRATSRMVVIEDRLQTGRLLRRLRGVFGRFERRSSGGEGSPGEYRGTIRWGLYLRLRSAAGLVDRGLAGRRAQVGLGDDGELGADLRGGRLAGQGRERLVHRVGPDYVRRLGDERLNGALLQRGDLIGLGVESDDLDLAGLTGLAHTGGGALGREQVGREDADDVRVLLQRRQRDLRGHGRAVLVELRAHVGELGVGLGRGREARLAL